MPEVIVNIAVIHGDKILLTQREDFETWILPSGGVEDGESLAEAAIRETKEETGLDVELTRLVGVYSRLGNVLSGHVVLFLAEPSGGEIKCQVGETIAVEWFSFDEIPSPLSLGHKRRIADAVNGIGGGVSVSQEFQFQNQSRSISRKELYDLRDKSALSRQKFYLQLVEQLDQTEKVEVGDV